jgi:hypothetical protein
MVTNPVLAWLHDALVQQEQMAARCQDGFPGWQPDPRLRAVIDHGGEYIGIERPKGFRGKRAEKRCFANAGKLAIDGRGGYVEGFAMAPGLFPMPHAWISIDGVHAIDPTWPNAPECFYFGIAFPTSVLNRTILRRGYWGLLDPVEADVLAEALKVNLSSP